MSGVVHHLVRRGFEAAHDHYNDLTNDYNGWSIASQNTDGSTTINEPAIKMPAWGGALLGFTIIAYFLGMAAMKYVLEVLLTTLTTIETPSYTPIALPDTSAGRPLLSEDIKEDVPVAEDLALIKNKPVTRNIRSTLKHLRSVAGRWSHYRGLRQFFAYMLAYNLLLTLMKAFIPYSARGSPIESIAAIASSVICVRLSITWTHHVISLPSDKPWYRRLATRQTAKKVILPQAVWAAAEQIAIYFPQTLASNIGLQPFLDNPQSFWEASVDQQRTVVKLLWLVIAVSLGMMLLVVLPAQVTLLRVQASTLPEENDTIIPFDRTFGGKVVPESEGGKGVVGMLDAWKTFGWGSRLRLVGLYAKIVAIQFTFTVGFLMVLVAEMRLILGGEKFDKVVRKVGGRED